MGASATPEGAGGESVVRLTIGTSLTQAQASTDGVFARARDFTAPLSAQVVPILARYFTERFASEGSYGGARWAKLARRTLRARKRNGRGRGGILVDRGDLQQSLVAPGAVGNLRDVTPTSLLYGSTLRTAMFAQNGTRQTRFGSFGGRGRITRATSAAEVHARFRPLAAPRSDLTPARPLIPIEGLPQREVDAITAALTAWVAEGKA